MKNAADTRRQNLKLIVDSIGLSEASRRFDKPDRQINDMISDPPRKSFGEKVARAMEFAFAPELPLGWLDQPGSAGQHVQSHGHESGGDMKSATVLSFPTKDLVSIPQYAAGGSMGHGLVLPEQPGVIEKWTVNHEWLDKNARGYTSVNNLCIVTGFGPSMRPMFNPGDPLLVDRGVKTVTADGIYFFRVGDEGFIKQLQKIPTSNGVMYRAKSANPDYDAFEITSDMDFEVLGKVLRVWCGTDF